MTSGIAPVPSTTMSASSTRPDSADDALHPAVALEARQRIRRHALDPVRVEHAGEEAARRRAEVGRERRVLDHHERAALAHRGQRGRDLAGDVGAADQHDALGVLGVGPDRRRRCRARAGSGSPRGRRRRRAAGARSRRSRAARGRSRRCPSSTAYAVLASVSSFITLVRVSSSMSCSAYHSAGCSSASSGVDSPRSRSFEHGGRW